MAIKIAEISDDEFQLGSTNILNGLKEDFKLVSGKNIFPINIFPPIIQKLISELESTLNFSPDYTSASILYAVSVSIGNRIQLKVKNSWLEKSNLYMVLVGRTGDVKSHSVSFCLHPLMKLDKQNFDQYLLKKKEFEQLAIEEKSKSIVPVLRQLLLNDFTPEAFVKAHYFNPRGIGLYTDEIAGFFNSFNQYRKGSEEESYLSAWSGKPIIKNRISGDEMRVDNTKVDIIGTMQEGILSSVFQSNKMKNGFIDRLLFVLPHKYVDNKWNDKDLDEKYIEWYSEFISKIFNLAENSETSLEFQPDAKKYLYQWQNSQKHDFDFEYQRGVSVKLQQYVLRFSILIEVIHSVCNDEKLKDISLKTLKSAINLRDYFFENAVRVFEIIDNTYYDSLTEIQKNVFDKLPQQFKTGEGIEIISKEDSMKIRSFKNFLKDEKLFKKIAHGIYEKQVF
ncbi:DUF3987 domain-containing protein [Chryseobacterium sp. 5_R23647]|uniref:DUF3987 domain-containing protein n=1 Tax=Chryseobacterium sp. 5_R23647 TaxID=2258964 RepID=UPI0014032A6E|nr:DUF3987 domain-containing protein [Chryseobacterium sp. 5_R23647]